MFSLTVIACNRLLLQLRQAVDHPTSSEPLSYSLAQLTIDGVFTRNITFSYDDRSQEIPLPKHNVLNDAQ